MTVEQPFVSAVRVAELHTEEPLAAQWDEADVLLFPGVQSGFYAAGLAASDACVRTALGLRFRVFNLELGEGLEQSAVDGLDQDEYDAQMDHVVLLDQRTRTIVGTYRVQPVMRGIAAPAGLYSAREYVLDGLRPYFSGLAECGRACVDREHRCMRAIHVLWLGMSAYLAHVRQRYLFGCCSLTSSNPLDGWRTLRKLRTERRLHPEIFLRATPEFSCGSPALEALLEPGIQPRLPNLFRAYLRMGAQVVSEPAIDRAFGTVDFLILLDSSKVNLTRMDMVHGRDE